MADLQHKGQTKNVYDLGNSITSWIYKPKRSNQFLFYILGLIGAVFLFALFYGERYLPWLKKVPEMAFYVIFIIVGPLINYLKSMGKNQEWTLYKNGFSVRFINKDNAAISQRVGYWKDYSHCTYDSKGVTLIGLGMLKKNTRVYTSFNVMEIYSICRECISMAQAEKLQISKPAPQIPNTPEQRRLARTQRQRDQEKSTNQSSWSDLFST